MEPYIDFAFVKEHADIRAVLAHYGIAVPANSAKNIKIRCLFHQEAHPSLSINLQRKVFHCFGCGVGVTSWSSCVYKTAATCARPHG